MKKKVDILKENYLDNMGEIEDVNKQSSDKKDEFS